MDRNRAVPRRGEEEKRRMWRKWHRPEPRRYRGGGGLRLGDLATGGLSRLAFPGVGGAGIGRGRAGRPGRGAGSCVVRNGAASRRPRLPAPSPPAPLGLQLPRRRFSSHRAPSAGKVETPRAPRACRPPTPGRRGRAPREGPPPGWGRAAGRRRRKPTAGAGS